LTIFIAHSVTLGQQAIELKARLEAAHHGVLMPMNPTDLSECAIHGCNAGRIRNAGLVFALWNGQSDGCPMDVAMAIALGRKVYVDLRNAQPAMPGVMVRAWALFEELPQISEWWEEQEKEKPPPD
jgi:hypothetical protein